MIVVTDWRSSRVTTTDRRAELSIGFTSIDPSTDFTKATQDARWTSLGQTLHSQHLDFSANPVWGKFILLKYSCSQDWCLQTMINYVYTSPYQRDPSTTISANAIHASALDMLLPRKFNSNCSTETGYNSGGGCTNWITAPD